MTQKLRQKLCNTRRQISPFAWTRKKVVHSYFGGMRACTQCRDDFNGDASTWSPCTSAGGSRPVIQGSPDRPRRRVSRASSSTVHNMHACNHTKNFISDMSHFWMDAKYLIMANTQAPVEIWKCDGRAAVFALESINEDDGESIWTQRNQ